MMEVPDGAEAALPVLSTLIDNCKAANKIYKDDDGRNHCSRNRVLDVEMHIHSDIFSFDDIKCFGILCENCILNRENIANIYRVIKEDWNGD